MEKKESEIEEKKSVFELTPSKKALTLLAGGMLLAGSGCSKDTKGSENITSFPEKGEEEILEAPPYENFGEEVSEVFVNQRLEKYGKYPNYSFKTSEEFVREMESLVSKDYVTYAFKSDYDLEVEKVKSFADFFDLNLGVDSSYDASGGFFNFNFAEPRSMLETNIDVKNQEDLKKVIDEIGGKVFPEGTEYKIGEIVELGEDYKISFDRVLDTGNGDQIPLYWEYGSSYLLVSKEGKVKEGSFFIAELEKQESKEVSLLTGEEFRHYINEGKFPKKVDFVFQNLENYDKFSPPFIGDSNSEGFVDLSSANFKIVYLFSDRNDVSVVPTLVFENAQGHVLLQGEGDEGLQKYEADFTVFANVVGTEHIENLP